MRDDTHDATDDCGFSRPDLFQMRPPQAVAETSSSSGSHGNVPDEFPDNDGDVYTEKNLPWWKGRCARLGMICFVFGCAIAGVVAWAVTRSTSSSSPPGEGLGNSTSDNGPSSDEEINVDHRVRFAAFLKIAEQVSDPTLLLDTDEGGSPQFKALDWMAKRDKVSQIAWAAATYEQAEDDTTKLVQRYVLAVFYFATGGETSWISDRHWLSPTLTECDWKYVFCNDKGQVTQLNTGHHGNGISGALPDELGKLSTVHSLIFPGNQVSDLPLKLQSLTDLVALNLNQNSVSGTIPSVIYKLTSLEILLMGSNGLKGRILPSVSDLSRLATLDLSHNQLSARLPFELLRNVDVLDVEHNDLKGSMGRILMTMTNASSLSLGGNKFRGTIPSEVGNMKNLEQLKLDSTILSSSIPTEVGLVTTLEYLDLTSTGLIGEIPTQLQNLSNLKELELLYNGFTGSFPHGVCNLITGELKEVLVDCDINCSCRTNLNCPLPA